jgi:hypothetical protein
MEEKRFSDYRQHRTWVEAGKWGWGAGDPIGVARLGKRASGSAAAWLVPPEGHGLQREALVYEKYRTQPAPLELHYTDTIAGA